MGIFTKRSPAPPTVTWQFASGPEVVACDRAIAYDAVGNNALELRFVSPAAPNSTIYVTFYATYAAPGESGYLIGYRYDLTGNSGDWSHTGWGILGSLRNGEQPYASADDALGACWRLALGYAVGSLPLLEELGGQVFTWDGQPW
jgi:hypothetical protein